MNLLDSILNILVESVNNIKPETDNVTRVSGAMAIEGLKEAICKAAFQENEKERIANTLILGSIKNDEWWKMQLCIDINHNVRLEKEKKKTLLEAVLDKLVEAVNLDEDRLDLCVGIMFSTQGAFKTIGESKIAAIRDLKRAFCQVDFTEEERVLIINELPTKVKPEFQHYLADIWEFMK